MTYPDNLIQFFQNLANRSLFSKVYSNPEKYKNSRIKHLSLFESFERISFPATLSISEKIKWVADGITSIPVCPQCENNLKISQVDGKYPEFCNQKCYLEFRSVNNLTAKSIMVDGAIYKSMYDAIKSLNISHYLIKQKIYDPRETSWKYYPDHDDQMKLELSYLHEIHPKLIDHEWLNSQKTSGVTMNEICGELGVKLDHLRLAYCAAGIDTNYDQIPQSSKKLLMDKNWLSESISTKFVASIADELNCGKSTIHQHCAMHGIDIPNRSSSLGEEELGEFIKSLGVQFDVRTRKIIYPLELDIYISTMRVAIEYNGVYHHREKELNHQEKYIKCRNIGIKLIQIFEDDWADNRELVQNKIIHILGFGAERIFARKCEILKVTGSSSKEFYNKHHIYGHKNCSSHFGLYHDGDLVALMSFIGNKLERYATSKTVVGGFSKLLTFAKTDLKLDKIVTFADLCWSHETDNVYVKNGFKFLEITKPNYWWVMKGKRVNRIQCQKHKLKNLKSYSDDKTEKEIMYEMGYYRVFDAGHAKLELDNDKYCCSKTFQTDSMRTPHVVQTIQ